MEHTELVWRQNSQAEGCSDDSHKSLCFTKPAESSGANVGGTISSHVPLMLHITITHPCSMEQPPLCSRVPLPPWNLVSPNDSSYPSPHSLLNQAHTPLTIQSTFSSMLHPALGSWCSSVLMASPHHVAVSPEEAMASWWCTSMEGLRSCLCSPPPPPSAAVGAASPSWLPQLVYSFAGEGIPHCCRGWELAASETGGFWSPCCCLGTH